MPGKTGKRSPHGAILDKIKALEMKSNDGAAPLQQHHAVPRYWASTLTTLHSKKKGSRYSWANVFDAFCFPL
jgi:hypothetical protein